MYWMLLPPSANAGRHIDDHSLPQSGSWGALFHVARAVVARLLALARH